MDSWSRGINLTFKGAFPSTLDFLQTARSVGLLFNAKKKLRPHLQPLNQYLDSMFKRNLTKGKLDINIEELLTYLEIDIEREKSAVLFQIREIIDNLIRELLSVLGNPLAGRAGEYSTLVGMLRPEDSVLTFNWDLLLDNDLGRLQALSSPTPPLFSETHYGKMLHYQMATGEGNLHEPYFNLQPISCLCSAGSFIKLHGSIDWSIAAKRIAVHSERSFQS